MTYGEVQAIRPALPPNHGGEGIWDTGKEGSRGRVFAAAADLFGTMLVFTWSNEGKLQKTSVSIADPK